MERKIGEKFDFGGETLEVVEQRGCEGCYFDHRDCSLIRNTRGKCSISRLDGISVIFKRVDKPLELLTLELLTKAHQELVQCGIESEIVQEIEEYLKTTTSGKTI
jgi:hypothetical protein